MSEAIIHRCRTCGTRMSVADCSFEPSVIEWCPMGCDELIVCMPTSLEDETLPAAFWKSDIPRGTTLVEYAVRQLGNQAHRYGFPAAAPG